MIGEQLQKISEKNEWYPPIIIAKIVEQLKIKIKILVIAGKASYNNVTGWRAILKDKITGSNKNNTELDSILEIMIRILIQTQIKLIPVRIQIIQINF